VYKAFCLKINLSRQENMLESVGYSKGELIPLDLWRQCNVLDSDLPIHLMRYEFKMGDLIPLQPNILWQIESGITRTLTWDAEGKVNTLGLWGKGHVVGEPLSQVSPYEIECLTAVKVKVLPSCLWEQIFDALLLHIQQEEELIQILHCSPVQTRLKMILVWLAEKFGKTVNYGKLIEIKLTHQQLAELICTTRVTVTRMVGKLEQQGIIDYGRDRIIIKHSLL
jgi:CRP-like cAMP-binding protein